MWLETAPNRKRIRRFRPSATEYTPVFASPLHKKLKGITVWATSAAYSPTRRHYRRSTQRRGRRNTGLTPQTRGLLSDSSRAESLTWTKQKTSTFGDMTYPDLEWKKAFTSVAFLLAILGNGLILRAFSTERALRTPANSLLASLAVVDLLFAVSFLLNILALTVDQHLDCIFFFLQGYYSFFLNDVVLLNLAAISAERLVAIKFSLRYPTLVTQFRVNILIAALWIVGVLANALPLLLKIIWVLNEHEEESLQDLFMGSHPPGANHSFRLGRCQRNNSENAGNPNKDSVRVFFWVDLVTLVLPYAVTIVCQVWIFKISREHYKQVKAQLESVSPGTKFQMKHVKTTALVLGSFLLLFTPLLVMVLLMAAQVSKVEFCILWPASFLASQSSWLNAPIYAWKDRVFRRAFWKSLKPSCSRPLCCRECRCCSEAQSRDLPPAPNEERA